MRQVSNGTCCTCRNEQSARWQKENRAARNAIERRYKKPGSAASARANQRTKQWQRANREAHLARKKEWKIKNIARNRWYVSQRRKKIRRASFPKYQAEIKSLYLNCPEGMEVDHIVPLSHPLVCGLHVPWNLQYLTPEANRLKSNKFEPTQENF